MYLMYVDESGDPGLVGSKTDYYILSGIVLHELQWKSCLDQLLKFRRRIKKKYGLRMREEIHSSAFINSAPSSVMRIPRYNRLAILRAFTNELSSMNSLNIISVMVQKTGKPSGYDVYSMAWKALIQRFENTILNKNFRGPMNPDERGQIFPDATQFKKLKGILRKMRYINYVPSHTGGSSKNMPINLIIEDPCVKESDDSYFIQAADLSAYLLCQYKKPCRYIKSQGAQNYFKRLEPVLCKAASPNDPESLGIVSF